MGKVYRANRTVAIKILPEHLSSNPHRHERFEREARAIVATFGYNFIKIHRTLRVTPAMAAGVTDRPWEVSDLVALIEAEEGGLERAA